jgi:hypothetical protein
MILPVRYSASGSIVTAANDVSGTVYIKLFLSDGYSQYKTVVRDFTIEEAKAFMEYLEGNLSFQIGGWTVELTETSRDALIADLGHAMFYLQRVNL